MVLARNKELDGVIQSIKSIERHFNRWFHYPYVFLNDGEFNQTFIDAVVNHTSAPVEWGKISPEDWGFPDWVDPAVAKEGIAKQADSAIMYGGMESYHHMCRFYSGYVHKFSTCILRLTYVGNSTSTNCYRNTNGIGASNRTSNIFAISRMTHSSTCRDMAKRMGSQSPSRNCVKQCQTSGDTRQLTSG